MSEINVQELKKQYEESPNIQILHKLNSYYMELGNDEAIYQIALEGMKYNVGTYFYNAGLYLSLYYKDEKLSTMIEYFKKAVELGHNEGLRKLSDIYFYKDFHSFDAKKSLEYILEYDKKSNKVSYSRIGKIYYYFKQYEEALDYLLEASKVDNSVFFYLGYIYSNERLSFYNYRLAAEYYQKAIDINSDKYAYNNLACMYHKGYGVTKDEKKAFEYMTKASELGNNTSKSNLALYYREGIGCEVDIKKAFELLDQVENKEENEYYLITLAATQKGNKEYAKAIETYTKAIKIGSVYAKFKLIMLYKQIYDKSIIYSDSSITKEKIYQLCNELYLEGLKVTESDDFKLKFLENSLLSSARDFINERRKIGDSKKYAFSKMVGNKNFKDIFTAIDLNEWTYRAILGYCLINEFSTEREQINHILKYENDYYSNINYLIGRKYEIGYKVDVDYEKAFNQYQKAIQNGHPMAYARLAYFYENGIYVEKDLKKAKEYYEVASNDALIGDTSLNTYSKEHRGVVEAQLALARLEEIDADRINNVYINPPSLPSSMLPKLPEYNKKAIYRNVMMRYDYAYSSGTLGSKIAYLNFYLKNRDLYTGNNLDELIEEIKDSLNTIEFLSYYYEKNDLNVTNKIIDNILNTNDFNIIKKLLKIEEDKNHDVSRILLKLASLGDEEAFYKFKLLKVEKDSDEYKKIIYEMANQNVYNALLQVLEYENDNVVYLHKVLDDPRIQFHLDTNNKYSNILGEIYFSKHQYEESSKYLLDQDKKDIALYLSNKSIENSYINKFIDKCKNLSISISEKKNTNFDLLYNELNEFIKFYNLQNKEKEYYKHIKLLSTQRDNIISNLLDYIKNTPSYNKKVYDILLSLNYVEVYSYLGKEEKDMDVKMIYYRLGQRLGSYYSMYNYAYLLYKHNKGLFKGSIRKEAVKIMEKIQYYFKPAHDFLNEYEKKYVKLTNDTKEIDFNLLEK